MSIFRLYQGSISARKRLPVKSFLAGLMLYGCRWNMQSIPEARIFVPFHSAWPKHWSTRRILAFDPQFSLTSPGLSSATRPKQCIVSGCEKQWKERFNVQHELVFGYRPQKEQRRWETIVGSNMGTELFWGSYRRRSVALVLDTVSNVTNPSCVEFGSSNIVQPGLPNLKELELGDSEVNRVKARRALVNGIEKSEAME
ncbi:hypothetical protein C8J56DRAFT_900277 [Mycena floridula]|nr:hypothetical protein C8J56DRAFT_900277 [Mycena floridula]